MCLGRSKGFFIGYILYVVYSFPAIFFVKYLLVISSAASNFLYLLKKVSIFISNEPSNEEEMIYSSNEPGTFKPQNAN